VQGWRSGGVAGFGSCPGGERRLGKLTVSFWSGTRCRRGGVIHFGIGSWWSMDSRFRKTLNPKRGLEYGV